MSPEQTRRVKSDPDAYRSIENVITPPLDPNLHAHMSDSQATLQGFRDTYINSHSLAGVSSHVDRRVSRGSYDVPDKFSGLNELAAPSPLDNPRENPTSHPEFLENVQSHDQAYECNIEAEFIDQQAARDYDGRSSTSRVDATVSWQDRTSRLATIAYTVSYLIFFSILGTLARLGLQALTFYPGTPVAFSELWANVGGSLIMGYLSEETNLFSNNKWNQPSASEVEKEESGQQPVNEVSPNEIRGAMDAEAERGDSKKNSSVKKIIPLYIGLTTGFCGSFTSFSSFIRDSFLAMSNQLAAVPSSSQPPTMISSRNGGYSFMALIAVIFVTVGLCLSALQIGAHLAIALEKIVLTIPVSFTRNVLDRLIIIVAWGMWFGSIFMTIWPPDRPFGPAGQGNTSWAQENWRGKVLFAVVFAPVGCLLRFFVSLHLNGVLAAFPLGTFIVNIFGTVILGMSWDLQRVPLSPGGNSIGGGVIGCQVLQGVQDGFCGCLTTVSTWVLELTGLRRKHAYTYGALSISVGLAFLVGIMGSLTWSRGVTQPVCS